MNQAELIDTLSILFEPLDVEPLADQDVNTLLHLSALAIAFCTSSSPYDKDAYALFDLLPQLPETFLDSAYPSNAPHTLRFQLITGIGTDNETSEVRGLSTYERYRSSSTYPLAWLCGTTSQLGIASFTTQDSDDSLIDRTTLTLRLLDKLDSLLVDSSTRRPIQGISRGRNIISTLRPFLIPPAIRRTMLNLIKTLRSERSMQSSRMEIRSCSTTHSRPAVELIRSRRRP